MPFTRVLLCVRDADERELYRSSIEEDGFEVEECDDAAAALERFQAEAYDVVIADEELGGEGGEELLRNVREINPSAGTILLVSSEQDAGRFEDSPYVSEVLVRPFNVIKLVCSIESCIEQQKVREASALDETVLPPEMKIRELEIKLDDYRSKLRDLSMAVARSEGLEQRLANLKDLVRRKDELAASLREKVESLEKELETLSSQHQASVRRYSATLEALREENAALGERLEKIVIQHRKQMELLGEDGDRRIGAYEERIASIEAEAQLLRKRVEELEREKAELLGRIESSDSEARRRVEELQRRLAEVQRELDEERRKRETDAGEEKKELIRLKERLEAMRVEAEEMQKQYAERIAELEEQIATEKKKVQTLLDYQQNIVKSMFCGFLSIDSSGKITLANKRISELMGVSLGKILGEKLASVEELQAVVHFFEQVMSQGGELEEKIFLVDKDGREQPVTIRCRKVRFGRKDVCLMLFDPVESAPADGGGEGDISSDPVYRFGAAVAADVVEFATQLRTVRRDLERVCSLATPDTPLYESANLALSVLGDTMDYLQRNLVDKAEKLLEERGES